MIEQMLFSQSKMEDMIQNYAEGHDGRIRLTEVLENWYRNKQGLFKLFGEKLRIETPIETELPERLMIDAACDFVSGLEGDDRYSLTTYFFNCINYKDIVTNTISESVVIMGEKINKGMKVTRALKFFVNPAHLDEIQTNLSKLIQSFKCKGTLVLSIDPIDYLLMSENGETGGRGWRSCHNIFDGEYKVGTLSYLQDSATIIAYVKTKDVGLYNNEKYQVANKIWRQCIYIDEKMTYAVQSRQYPSTSTPNRSQATKLLTELLSKYNEGKTYSSRLINTDYINIIDEDESYHYNDINSGHMSEARVIALDSLTKDDRVFANLERITIGHPTQCLCGCGRLLSDGNFLSYETQCEYDDWY